MNHTTQLRPPPTPPPTPPRPSGRRRWWAAGFTLIELIVVVIIMAILVGIATFGYNRFTGQAKDTVTATNLREMGKALIVDLQHRQGSTYTMDDVTLVANQVSPLVADGAPHLAVTTGPATVTDVSVAIDAIDAGKVGLALRSPTGKCFLVRLDGVDLKAGQGNDSPTCTGTIAKDTANLDDPTADPTTPGNGGPVDDGFTGTLTASGLVTARPGIPESTDATVTWSSVAGAQGYEVYLDGATDPMMSVTTTSAILEALAEGSHTVAVRATRGTGASLVRGPAASATFTIKYADNDNIADARKILAPTTRGTTAYNSNLTGSLEAGEDGGYRSLWWKFTPTADASYVIRVASQNTNIRVGTSASAAATADVADKTPTSGGRFTVLLQAGTTYYIRAAATTNTVVTYSFELLAGPSNDLLANAQQVAIPDPGKFTAFTADTTDATVENGESAGWRSLWWKMTPPKTGTYGLSADSNALLQVNSSRDVTAAGDVANLKGSPSGSSLVSTSLVLEGGATYYIRIFQPNATGGVGSTRFIVYGGPTNDILANAQEIVAPDPGQTQTFTTAPAARYATMEPGEGGTGLDKSLWWTMTPTRTGPYVFSLPGYYQSLRIGTSNTVGMAATTADVRGQDLNEVATLTAGTTYYIQTAITSSNGTNGDLTVSGASLNDMIADAQPVTLDPEETVTFNVNSRSATLEAGEGPSGAMQTLWWKITPPQTSAYLFKRTGAFGFLRIGTTPSAAATGDVVEQSTGFGPYVLQGGRTYYVRINPSPGGNSRYALSISRGPSNTLVAGASDIAPPSVGQIRSYRTDLSAAPLEAGETVLAPSNTLRSAWWKMTPQTSGSYEIATDGTEVRVSTSPDVAVKGDVLDKYLGTGQTMQRNTVSLQGGVTYYIRMAGGSGNYSLNITGK